MPRTLEQCERANDPLFSAPALPTRNKSACDRQRQRCHSQKTSCASSSGFHHIRSLRSRRIEATSAPGAPVSALRRKLGHGA